VRRNRRNAAKTLRLSERHLYRLLREVAAGDAAAEPGGSVGT